MGIIMTDNSGKTNAAVEGRNISKVFNDFWGRPKATALKDLDITVEEGTIFGLLGPNGAGKSTLIKLLLGHLYPTKGVLQVLGRSPRDVEIKRRIGYMPERTAFYSALTSRETLVFFGRLIGLSTSEINSRTRQLLSMVGLEHAADRYVGEFSYGMKKRLCLAQCLINDPDLLLLDEPTAGLDPIGCREVKDLIITLGKRGKTILMTSHLLADIQDVCGKIMILYAGQAQASGPVHSLLAKKDEILIRTSPLSEEKLREAEKLLRNPAAGSIYEVSYPTRTLEEYFLSVVAEASKSGRSTSGAQIGGGMADYLTEGVDSAFIDGITRRMQGIESEPRKEKINVEELRKLTQDKEAKTSAGKNEVGKPVKDAVDKELLSSLTKKN